MLHDTSLVALACRASNLAERLFLLKQLGEGMTVHQSGASSAVPVAHYSALTSLDLEDIEQDVDRLFPSAEQSAPFERIKRQTIRRSLRLYRWYERNLSNLSTAQQQIFLKTHATWFQTYQQAIACYGDAASHAQFSRPQMLDGKQSNAGYAPFIALIAAELTPVLELVQPHLKIASISRQVRLVQRFFEQRIMMMVAHVMEEDSAGLWSTQTEPQPETMAEIYHRFYLQFPVLARWLAQVCGDVIHLVQKAIARLQQDQQELSHQFWDGVAIAQFGLRLRQEDVQGQWTILMDFGLVDGREQQVAYYPHDLEAELGLQTLFSTYNSTYSSTYGGSTPSPYHILRRSDYGYIGANTACSSFIHTKLQQVGQSMAVQHLLGHRGLWGRIGLGVHRSRGGGWLTDSGLADSGLAASGQEGAIQEGFESLKQWFCTQPSRAAQAFESYFAIATAKICPRSPGSYLLLLMTAQQSAYLSNPLAVDAIFRVLVDQPCPWDSLGEIAQLEIRALWQFKMLNLTLPMGYRYMLYDSEHALFSKLPLSPLEFLTRRISQYAARHYSKTNSAQSPSEKTPPKDSSSFELAMNP